MIDRDFCALASPRPVRKRDAAYVEYYSQDVAVD